MGLSQLSLRSLDMSRGLTMAIAAAALLSACTTPSAPPAKPVTAPEFADEYRIGVGDALAINVWRNEDLSVSVPVRPDGKVSVPLAGDVMVGHKTPEEVAAVITEKLATFIRDPYVTVIVTEMGSDQYRSRVRVTGAVEQPVSLPYRQGMTVLDVVLEAGGTTEFANEGGAVLFRPRRRAAGDSPQPDPPSRRHGNQLRSAAWRCGHDPRTGLLAGRPGDRDVSRTCWPAWSPWRPRHSLPHRSPWTSSPPLSTRPSTRPIPFVPKMPKSASGFTSPGLISKHPRTARPWRWT